MERVKVVKRVVSLTMLTFMLVFVGVLGSGNKLAVKAAAVGKVEKVIQTSAGTNSVTIKWTAATGATKYYVEIAGALYITKECQYTITGLVRDQDYQVEVRGYNESGKRGVLGTAYVKTIPNNVTGFRLKSYYPYSKKCHFGWNGLQGVAGGYEFKLLDGKNRVVNTQNISWSSSAAFAGDIGNQAYTAQVRSYITVNGKRFYSDWVSLGFVASPQVTKRKVSSGKLHVKWKKVTGATGYDIYVSTSKKKGYKKVKSVGANKTSTKIAKFKKKKYNSRKTYYVYVVAKKKIGNSTYKSKPEYYWNSKNSKKISF